MLFYKTKIFELYWVYTLFSTAKSLVSILGPIYLFRLDYSLSTILIYFIITAVIKVCSLPIVFMLAGRYGAKLTTCLGVLLMVTHVICFAFLEKYHIPLPILAATLGLANAFFYPSFRISFSLASENKKAGTQVAMLNTLSLLFGAVAPLVGGVIATLSHISVAYCLATIIFMAAFVLLIGGKKVDNPSFSFSKIPRGGAIRDYVSNASYSTSGLADLLVWPLLISFIIPSYAGIGAYAGLVVVAAIVIQLWTGVRGDKKGERNYLVAGALVGVIYNILRVLASSVTHLIGLSFVSAISSSLLSSSFGGRFYKNIARDRHLEYLFGMEMANSITWLVYFPLLLVISSFLSVEDTLRAGVILIVPAVLGMMLVRFQVNQAATASQTV